LKPLGGHIARPTAILVHGTPTLNTLYWTEDRPDSFCVQMATIAGAKPGDVLAFGHTHKPWYRQVEGIHFVNTGSVGRPKDGDWRAGYVLLDVDEAGARGLVRSVHGSGDERNSGERLAGRVRRVPPDRRASGDLSALISGRRSGDDRHRQ
jgi:hypothetical protein